MRCFYKTVNNTEQEDSIAEDSDEDSESEYESAYSQHAKVAIICLTIPFITRFYFFFIMKNIKCLLIFLYKHICG